MSYNYFSQAYNGNALYLEHYSLLHNRDANYDYQAGTINMGQGQRAVLVVNNEKQKHPTTI